MLAHELGHVLTTYLWNGGQDTPTRIRGTNPQQEITNIGEAGEFFERGVFSGTIDERFDNQIYGNLG